MEGSRRREREPHGGREVGARDIHRALFERGTCTGDSLVIEHLLKGARVDIDGGGELMNLGQLVFQLNTAGASSEASRSARRSARWCPICAWTHMSITDSTSSWAWVRRRALNSLISCWGEGRHRAGGA